ncbi:MAG: CDP-alcohol phosphatidyltransferase family protein [Pseudomonadota bacterium]
MRITANQVTFARLVFMPFLGLMVYGDWRIQIAGVVFGTMLGCTDFIDGYLARKHGPTILGGLMDPIADKVFIAVGFLPYADLGWVPWWMIALLFLREFLITALRSSFELRQRTLATSYLAKVKTWFQMVGMGLLLLAVAVSSHSTLCWVLGALAAGPVAAWIVYRLATGKAWHGALIGCAGLTPVFLLEALAGRTWLIWGIMICVLGITWISGLDYLSLGIRELARSRRALAADWVRLAGAIALPFGAVATLTHVAVPAWPIIVLVAVELAHGGLDNLLAHYQTTMAPWAWGVRVLGAGACLGAALLVPDHAQALVYLALGQTIVWGTCEFVRKRRFYLEVNLREKKAQTA